MRLLICTQTVDSNDPVLGFFHRWIEELAAHSERVTVICLRAGQLTLPRNVEVIALGNEFKLTRAIEVCAIAYGRRKEYEAVLVHMNQEYILAGGWLWRLLRKNIYLWRNHYAGNILTDVAAIFCRKVFCTSRYSYTAKYKKTVLMPVGIDLERFAPVKDVSRIPSSILFLSRIAPSKRPHILIEALTLLAKRGVPFSADLYGSPGKGDEDYAAELRDASGRAGLSTVTFGGAVPNAETPRIYTAHEVYVNLSPSGMYDKTIFEAIACGCTPITSSDDFKLEAGDAYWFDGTAEGLARKVEMHLGKGDASQLKSTAQRHSLGALIEKLKREIL